MELQEGRHPPIPPVALGLRERDILVEHLPQVGNQKHYALRFQKAVLLIIMAHVLTALTEFHEAPHAV